jgi:hypothetical protein
MKKLTDNAFSVKQCPKRVEVGKKCFFVASARVTGIGF